MQFSWAGGILDACVVANTSGNIVACNDAACRLFQWSEDQLVGRNVKILMPATYARLHHHYIRRYQKYGNKKLMGVPRELQGRRKDGTLFPIELSLGSTVQKGNEFYVATFRDISRKKIFEQIKLSSRYEEEFEELEPLGYGGFGAVFKCRNKLDGCIYAIKKIVLQAEDHYCRESVEHDPLLQLHESARRKVKEVQLLARISHHPNIARYYTSWLEPHETETINLSLSKARSVIDEQKSAHKPEVDAKVMGDTLNILNDLEAFRKSKPKSQRNVKGNGSKYQIITLLGKGGYAAVYLVRDNEDHQLYALKVVRKAGNPKLNNLLEYLRIMKEGCYQMKADSDCVVKLYSTFDTVRNFYIAMEYVPGGTLRSLLSYVGFLEEDVAVYYSAQIVRILETLHANGIVHRDLKPENLLIDKKGHLKLTDFGLSCEIMKLPNLDHLQFSMVGTPDYVAPEVALLEGHSFAADWWALGIIIFELLTGCPPFNDRTVQTILNNAVRAQIPWPEEIEISVNAQAVVSKLLHPSPRHRLGAQGAEEVKRESFFTGIDWTTLRKQPSPHFIPQLDTSHDTKYFQCQTETKPKAHKFLQREGSNELPLNLLLNQVNSPEVSQRRAIAYKLRQNMFISAGSKKEYLERARSFTSPVRYTQSSYAHIQSSRHLTPPATPETCKTEEVNNSSEQQSTNSSKSKSKSSGSNTTSSISPSDQESDSDVDSDSSITPNDDDALTDKDVSFVLYIQMEYYPALTMREWLDSPTRIVEMDLVYNYLTQLLRGLAFLHKHGIIHRDIKPSNIFVDDDVIKIGDFGLATTISLRPNPQHSQELKNLAPFCSDPKINILTMGVGTTLYAPLEQLSGASYDQKADIFSLGVIFVEMLCPSFSSQLEKHTTLLRVRQGVLPFSIDPISFEASLSKRMLAKSSSHRPAADELLETIQRRKLGGQGQLELQVSKSIDFSFLGERRNTVSSPPLHRQCSVPIQGFGEDIPTSMTEIFPEERFFCNLTTSHSLDSGLSRYRFSSMSGSSEKNLMANIAELIRSRDHEIVQLKQRVNEKDIKIKILEKKQRRLRRRFKRYKKKNKHFKSRRHDKSHAQTHGNAPPRENVT